MGIKPKINFYAVSNSSSFSAGIQSLLKRNNEIFYNEHFDSLDSALKNFCFKREKNNCLSIQNNDIIFLDDLSFDKIQILNFINSLYSCFRLSSIKTIVYTNCHDGEYLNSLKRLEVKAILHDEETPLREAFRMLRDEDVIYLPDEYARNGKKGFRSRRTDGHACMHVDKTKVISNLISLPHIQTCKKFLNTFRLVNDEKTYYDTKANVIISGHVWARSEKKNLNIDDNDIARIVDKRLPFSIGCVKKKIKGLIVTAAPIIAAGIISLVSSDDIRFETKKYTDINKVIKTELADYDFVICDDSSNTIEQYTLLELFSRRDKLNNLNYPVDGNNKPGSKIIFYTRSNNVLYLRQLRDRAKVVLLHEESPKEFLEDAINEFYKGNNYLDPTIDKKINDYNKYLSTHPLTKLTTRQLIVFNEVSNGWKNQQIAENLCVTIKDIEKHKTDLLHKLNIKSDELGHFAIEYKDEIKYLLEFPLEANTM